MNNRLWEMDKERLIRLIMGNYEKDVQSVMGSYVTPDSPRLRALGMVRAGPLTLYRFECLCCCCDKMCMSHVLSLHQQSIVHRHVAVDILRFPDAVCPNHQSVVCVCVCVCFPHVLWPIS